MASLELDLLGEFQARAAGVSVDVPGRKERALLAVLALPPGQRHSRDKLAGLLWSDRGDKQARDSLKSAISRLKGVFGSLHPPPIVSDRECLSLDRERVAVDVAAFERLISEGTPESIAKAITAYRGDLLDGLNVRDPAFEEWLLLERQRLRVLARDALGVLLDRHLAIGAHDGATAVAHRLLALDPLREAAHRALMQIYAEQGQTALALKQYQLCRDTLQRELGVKPEPETDQLYRSIHEKRATTRRTQIGAPPAGPSAESRSPEVPFRQHNLDVVPSLGKRSIAVLPFTNMSGDPEQEYFSDGITEDIITDLSRVSALFLVARHTSFMFKGKAVAIVDVARQLNVAYILEGSVRKSGNRVRISAQLVDGMTAGHVWAERYDRELVDIFAVQDEIAKSIVAALKVRLLPEELESIADRSTTNADAYECYLQGRAKFIESWGSRSTMRAARNLFLKAAEIDRGYAKAYAGIAGCDAFLWVMGDHDISYERIQANSDKALQLAPDLPEAHAFRGVALFATGHLKEASLALARAIELDPVLFGAHFFYGIVSRNLGDWNAAASAFQRAAALRSDDFASLMFLSDVYELLGQHEESKAAARRGMIRIASILSQRPDRAEVLAMGAANAVYVEEYALAEEQAYRAVQLEPNNFSVRYNAACAYAVMGKADTAMEHLEYIYSKMPRAGQLIGGFIAVDPQLKLLRTRTDFQALLKHIEAGAPS